MAIYVVVFFNAYICQRVCLVSTVKNGAAVPLGQIVDVILRPIVLSPHSAGFRGRNIAAVFLDIAGSCVISRQRQAGIAAEKIEHFDGHNGSTVNVLRMSKRIGHTRGLAVAGIIASGPGLRLPKRHLPRNRIGSMTAWISSGASPYFCAAS